MRVTKDLLGDTMDPHKAARTDRRGVDETRTERTADLPNIINVQLERHNGAPQSFPRKRIFARCYESAA